MFYSHQLLARKTPLGQIWMAATTHGKINRNKLDKISIIQVCDEILNPSVPMALRLSGILMGGVVIVYERKVKLVHDDAKRLLIKLNEAWKVKDVPDSTILPKGKTRAKREAVTLPGNKDAVIGDTEQTFNENNAGTAMEFQQDAFSYMRLDAIYFNNLGEDDLVQSFHQAHPDDINLDDHCDSYQDNIDRFETFDIDGDGDTPMNFEEIPPDHIYSPPFLHKIPEASENQSPMQVDDHFGHLSSHWQQMRQEYQRQAPAKGKMRKKTAFIMNDKQTVITNLVYQDWLQDASDTKVVTGRKRKARSKITPAMKFCKSMELPLRLLTDNPVEREYGGIPCSTSLKEFFKKCAESEVHNSPSGRVGSAASPQHSSQFPPESLGYRGLAEYEYHHGDFVEDYGKLREGIVQDDSSIGNLTASFKANLNRIGAAETNMTITPGNSVLGDDVKSISSSASGYNIPSNNTEINPRRRPASSRHGRTDLEPLDEENPVQYPDDIFELSKPETELLVETGPTQTQPPVSSRCDEKITESMHTHLRKHFETPGSAQVESLDKLTDGMNKKAAAMVFYQTCVLATRGVLKVEQGKPYGEIFISKGPKM